MKMNYFELENPVISRLENMGLHQTEYLVNSGGK